MKRTVLSIIMAVFVFTALYAQERRYGIERAILKKNSEMNMGGMQQSISSTQYIDEYGNKESMESVVSMAGQTINMFTMMQDGYVYNANLTAEFGTKVNVAAAAATEGLRTINLLNLTDEVRQQYQIVEKGNETFLGKECRVYELDITAQGQNLKVTLCVWQGLSLKSSMTVAGITITEETTEIQEGAVISKEKFELPEGINFIEMPVM